MRKDPDERSTSIGSSRGAWERDRPEATGSGSGSVAEAGDTLYVEVEEASPDPACVTTAALTQPVLLVAVPLMGSAGRFVERESALGC